MTRKALAAIAATAVVSAATTALASAWYFGQEDVPEGVISSTIESAVLAEPREVLVHLPEGYDSDTGRRYAAVYVLDGSAQDGHTARSAALMARLALMPQVIVVGVPNVSGSGRERDYTPPFMVQDLDDPKSPLGQGDRFLRFLKSELIPQIDRTYRTTETRMLLGHSRGALLVTYSLLAEPGLFQARFAHSPALWREHTVMADKMRESFIRPASSPASFFYMSLGDREVSRMATAFDRVREVLAHDAPSNLRWQADRIPNADHQSNGERATPIGFRAWYREAGAR
jgi:predicted alpha/beta superfamily hydrolase